MRREVLAMAEAETPVRPPKGDTMRSSQSLRSSDTGSAEPMRSKRPGAAVEEVSVPDEETPGVFRVRCPDCRQPIALLPGEGVLPEHATCPTLWNPFGL